MRASGTAALVALWLAALPSWVAVAGDGTRPPRHGPEGRGASALASLTWDDVVGRLKRGGWQVHGMSQGSSTCNVVGVVRGSHAGGLFLCSFPGDTERAAFLAAMESNPDTALVAEGPIIVGAIIPGSREGAEELLEWLLDPTAHPTPGR